MSDATEGERANAERKMDAWLERHGKTRADIAAPLRVTAAVARCLDPRLSNPAGRGSINAIPLGGTA